MIEQTKSQMNELKLFGALKTVDQRLHEASVHGWALACAVVLIFDIAIPPLVSSLYVKPNELTLQRPFLEHHIEATRDH